MPDQPQTAQGGEEQDHTGAICRLQDFPGGGSGDTSTWKLSLQKCKAPHPTPPPLAGSALDRGRRQGGEVLSVEVQLLCNHFPSWKPRGPWCARVAALFKHRELELLSHQHILSADPARATHKRVANPDSYPLSQEESKLILTPGQRPSPGLSCYLDQPDGERPKESRAATENTTEKSRSLPLSPREGKLPLRCLLNTVKQHFGCGQTQEVANVLIPSTSLCARHSSGSFRHTDQYSFPRGRAPL